MAGPLIQCLVCEKQHGSADACRPVDVAAAAARRDGAGGGKGKKAARSRGRKVGAGEPIVLSKLIPASLVAQLKAKGFRVSVRRIDPEAEKKRVSAWRKRKQRR